MRNWRFMTWVILGFNLLMLAWLIGGLASTASNCDGLSGAALDACDAGTAIGATIGAGIIVFFWVAGDLILGLLWLVTGRSHRECPACGSRVKRGRTICVRCGHDFSVAFHPR